MDYLKNLKQRDKKIASLILAEEKRQRETLMMIPSENYAPRAVREALASVLTNKYAEGYPFRRYYQGQKYIDQVETLCVERVKKMFGVPYANVQPYSGSPANAAVYFALLEYGDTLMGLRLNCGGHITHGLSKISFSGKYFKSCPYSVNKEGKIDYGEVEKLAIKNKPKIIIAGTTHYPLQLDFKRFAKIADRVGAYLMADVAHVVGLIIAGVYPDPVPYCHVITFTTHKTLRGPRGAVILVTKKGIKKDPDLPTKIDKAVFPGLQGGPHENQIAALAVALAEASRPGFKKYGQQIVKNAVALANELKNLGFKLQAGGTNTHVILIELLNKGVSGRLGAEALEQAGIVVNRNAIPNDPNPPYNPSGIRLGTPALTTRGMKERQMRQIARYIEEVIKECQKIKRDLGIKEFLETPEQRKEILRKCKSLTKINRQVRLLCQKFLISL